MPPRAQNSSPQRKEKKTDQDNLGDLIVMLRRMIDHVAVLAKDEAGSLDTWLEVLNRLSLASTRLAGLLKTRQALGGDDGLAELQRAFEGALEDMRAGKGP